MEIRLNKDDYTFLYETHLHTSESSKCSHSDGSEMAEACKKAGYTGIFVTNHNWYGNTCIDKKLPWEEWVRAFSGGYEAAREQGERTGLQVFFGYESCYAGTEFLVYGVMPEWLIKHPEIKDASIEEQYMLIHKAGGMVIQAHPFREEAYIPEIRLYPGLSDGAEGINATHSNHLSTKHYNTEFDERAVTYCGQNGLIVTAGSDVHDTVILGGGMAFKRKLASADDFCRAVLSGEDYLLTNGDRWYTKRGEPLPD